MKPSLTLNQVISTEKDAETIEEIAKQTSYSRSQANKIANDMVSRGLWKRVTVMRGRQRRVAYIAIKK